MLRIVHLSDIHIWRIALDPRRLANKRLIGMTNLVVRRRRHFRLDGLPAVVERVAELRPDHLLITGDLTTTALDEEFVVVRRALDPLLGQPERVTIIPGNHDRYTGESVRAGRFEYYLGRWTGNAEYPYLRVLDDETALLALDPCRANRISSRGFLSEDQLSRAAEQLKAARGRYKRLIVACHYPFDRTNDRRWWEGRGREMANADRLAALLAGHGPVLYCHGHTHQCRAEPAAGAPDVLCVNAGSPLRVGRDGRPSGVFLELLFDRERVSITRHQIEDGRWQARVVFAAAEFWHSTPVRQSGSRSDVCSEPLPL